MRQQRGTVAPVSPEVERLRVQEQKLRQQRIMLLKRELAGLRGQVRALEKELRLLGEPEALTAAGRIRWGDVYEQLGRSFTAKEMQSLTGASTNLVGSILYRWKEQGRIVTTGQRGKYRKKQ